MVEQRSACTAIQSTHSTETGFLEKLSDSTHSTEEKEILNHLLAMQKHCYADLYPRAVAACPARDRFSEVFRGPQMELQNLTSNIVDGLDCIRDTVLTPKKLATTFIPNKLKKIYSLFFILVSSIHYFNCSFLHPYFLTLN